MTANALSVLNNTADVFDSGDTVPGGLLAQISAKASDRFANVNLGSSTWYLFFNTTVPPFNSQLVREAVVAGLDQNAMNKLSSGTLSPGCYFVAPAVPGHPTAPCPYGNPSSGGDLAKARALVERSGLAGTKVTVWSEIRPPGQQWMTYYTTFLNQIGLKASIQLIADANYFTTNQLLGGDPANAVWLGPLLAATEMSACEPVYGHAPTGGRHAFSVSQLI